MIEMKCPACGAGGRAPREKIGARLVCKKCLRAFYLLPSGKAVLGEPPQQKDAPKERAPREYGLETPQVVEQLFAKAAKFRIPDPRTLAIIGGVALVALLGYWFFSRQTLEKRARTVAQAIISADMKQVVDVCVPGTENEAIQWYADTYKRYLDLKLTLGMDAGIQIKNPGESQGGAAMVIAVFSKDGLRPEGSALIETTQPIPSLANAPQSLDVPLFFVTDAWGNWVLDGKRTQIGGEFAPGRQPAGPNEPAGKRP